MKWYTVGPALASALTIASPSLAADLPSRQAPPPFLAPEPVANWAGFYAGTVFGGGFSTVRTSQVTSRSKTISGQTGGALIGYNFQTGPYVFGIEGDLTLHLIRGTNIGQAGLIPTNIDSLYSGHVRGRLGYDLGNFLPFVAGGFATGEFYQSNVSPLADFGSVRRVFGWTAGAGVDFRFNAPIVGPLTLRGEYVYESLGRQSYPVLGGPVRTDFGTHFFRAALIYRPGEKLLAGFSSPAPGGVDWSGGYGGVIGGGESVRARTRLVGAPTGTIKASGPMGGIYTGRNFQFGSIVIGYDGSIMVSDLTGRGSEPTSPLATYRNYIQGDLRGRAGYAFGAFLPYVAAGVTFGRSEQRDLISGSERGRVPSEGYTFGGGLEYKVSDHLSVRGEYLYEASLSNSKPSLNNCLCIQTRNGNAFRFGTAYHF